MTVRLFRLVLLIVSCVIAGEFRPIVAEDSWPQFRGPNGQGTVDNGRIPLKFDEKEGVVWRADIPGRGWSSPVIQDGVCWLTTAVVREATPELAAKIRATKLAKNPLAGEMEVIDSVSLRVIGVDMKSGTIRIDQEIFNRSQPDPIHRLNSFASPTCIVEEGKVYCHFGTFGTACVDASTGEALWKTRIAVEHSVGPGSTPVLHDGMLIFPCDGTEAQFVVALHAENGKQAWKKKRPKMQGDTGDFHKAFSTPLVINDGTKDQCIAPGAQWVVSYAPKTGNVLWQVRHGDGFSNSPRPVFAHGMVYICTGYMNHELLAIKVDGKGDVTKSRVVWRTNKQVPPMSSPLVSGDRLYMISEEGVVSCLDARTGNVKHRNRLPGNYSASPIAVDGKVVFLSRTGEVTLIADSDQWEVLQTNHIDGQLMASPAVWENSLVIRTDKALYRFADNSTASR